MKLILSVTLFAFLMPAILIAQTAGNDSVEPWNGPPSHAIGGENGRAINDVLVVGTTTGTALINGLLGHFSTVDYYDATAGTPTLGELQAYDAVVTYSGWGEYQDQSGLGDVFADFADGGGGVILTQLNHYDSPNYYPGGRLLDPEYMTMNKGGGNNSPVLGTFDPNHPIMDGVSAVSTSYGIAGVSIYSGAIWVADWTDGLPAVVVSSNEKVVGINMYISDQSSSSGDWILLIANALNFSAGGGGPALPRIDVEANGEDSNVEVFDGANVTVTIDVQARDYAGFPVEIWVVGVNKTSGGIFSYGAYPAAVWLPGVCNFYYGGGLMDMAETALDQPLPLGDYDVYLALEMTINGQLNLPFIWDYDMVDIHVVAPPTDYKWDSGTTDNLLCWTSGGDMVGMHCFDTIPGGEALTNVGTIFGSSLYSNYAPGNGTPTDFYVWEATSFGDPTNATLLTQGTGVVGNVDLDLHYWDACPCTVTTPNFYVAYNLHHAAYEYCLSIDSTNPYVYGAAFYTGTNTMNGFDPANLYGNQYPPAESPYGFWTVRAEY